MNTQPLPDPDDEGLLHDARTLEPPPHVASTIVVGPNAAPAHYSHGALLFGRSLYWTTARSGAEEQATALITLMAWCADQKGVHFGVDPRGLGRIVRSLAQQSETYALSPSQERLLQQAGVSDAESPIWPHDLPIFGPHRDKMLRLLRAAVAHGGYCWLSAADRRWWLEATAAAIMSYSESINSLRDESLMLPRFTRHMFRVAAPLDRRAFAAGVRRLMDAQAPAGQRREMAPLVEAFATNSAGPPMFWSWQPLNLIGVRGNIVNTPLLTLWNHWPTSRALAPAPPPDWAQAPHPMPVDRLAAMLQDMWISVETIFAYVSELCGVRASEPEFGQYSAQAPICFLAAPATLPRHAAEYAGRDGPPITPLIETCLATADAGAPSISWGVLGGDLVGLRNEVVSDHTYTPRLLILPTDDSEFPSPASEESVIALVRRMQFVEFEIAHNARDLDTDADPLNSRHSLWGGTLDAVSQLLDAGLELLPSTRQGDLARLAHRLRTISVTLARLDTRLAKSSSDVEQLQRRFERFTNDMATILHTQVASAAVAHEGLINLSTAIANAFPYRTLRPSLAALRNQTSTLVQGAERLRTLLSAAMDEADRLAKDRLARWTGLLAAMVAFIALLVALPQFIPNAALKEDTYPRWLDRAVKLSWVEAGVRYPALLALAVGIAGGIIILGAIAWRHLRPGSQDPFAVRMQTFNALVTGASQQVQLVRAQARAGDPSGWRAIEETDESATGLLASLWREVQRGGASPEPGLRWPLVSSMWRWLRAGRRVIAEVAVKAPGGRGEDRRLDEWITQADRLHNLILLLDLAPESIPLPRSLCVYRCKSEDHLTSGMIAEWYFESSLLAAGFYPPEIRRLKSWLSDPDNQTRIRAMDVETFCAILRARGVTADPRQRTPARWLGEFAA